jgi:hypothetical protein
MEAEANERTGARRQLQWAVQGYTAGLASHNRTEDKGFQQEERCVLLSFVSLLLIFLLLYIN